MNKKILTGLFTFLALFIPFIIPNSHSVQAIALSYDTSGFTYTIVDETVSVTGYIGYGTEIKVPAVIDNMQVNSIEYGAFSDNQDIISVSVPKAVNCIGDFALGYYYDSVEDEFIKSSDFCIICYTGTVAEQYAIANGFQYQLVDSRPDVVKGFKSVASTTDTIKLIWDHVQDANGYIIYNYDIINNKWVRIVKSYDTANTYKLTKLNAGTTYKLAIKAYKIVDGVEVTSPKFPILAVATNPYDVTAFKVVSTSVNAIKLSWNKVPGAKGYIVYQAKNGKWSRIAKTTTTDTSYIVRNLGKGSAYRFAIKAYKTVNNIEIASIKFPTIYGYTNIHAVTGFKISAVSDSAVKLTWNKLTDANGYIVYQMKNNKWVRVVKTSNNSNVYTITKLSDDRQYKFAVKGYKTVNEKEVVSYTFPTTNARTKKAPIKIQVKNGVTYINNVLVVNKTYKLPSTYNPGGLTQETYNAFLRMQKGATKSNVSLWITSGYRSYSYQKSLYNSYVASDGQAVADRYSARPGYSEHQTGLAIDVNYASSWFNNTTCAKWIENHCAEYGFILRYPRGKESKTGYMYESWHVRYVGVDLAKKVMASGLCLEEYFGITSKYK